MADMAGNLPPVTTAPARTAASSVPGSSTTSTSISVETGKVAPTGGQPLPVPVPEVPKADLDRALEQLTRMARESRRNLRFSVDESSGRTVITVINAATDEVVRQIPSQEILELARNMKQLGLLIDALA